MIKCRRTIWAGYVARMGDDKFVELGPKKENSKFTLTRG
jgi:hypothetical protein